MHKSRQSYEATKMTRARGFSDAVKRVFHQEFEQDLQIGRKVEFCEDQSKLLRRLDDFMAFAFFYTEGNQLVLAALNAPSASSIVQCQTLGSATRLRTADWQLTTTEGALLGPLCEKVLYEFLSETRAEEDDPLLSPPILKFVSSDRALLALMLEMGVYSVVETRCTGDTDESEQRFLLAFSAEGSSAVSTIKPATVEQAMLRVETEFRAILSYLHISVEDVKGLEVGQTFSLDRTALEKGVAVSSDGFMVHEIQLGKMDKLWAMKFVSEITLSEKQDIAHDTSPASEFMLDVEEKVKEIQETEDAFVLEEEV
jgi:hypothetical protein